MSRKINQKKEAFLASGGLLRSAGLAVPVAGVSSISNFIHQAHHLPAMQQHPGRVRGPHFCMKLRHYKILHSVPAPVFSACNLVRSPGQNAGAITLKNYAPLENGPQSRLHNFRVGAAGPINLRPVFFSKFYPGNLPRPIYFRFSTVWHNHLRNKHLTEHLRNNSNELATVRFSAFCGAMLSNNSFLMQR